MVVCRSGTFGRGGGCAACVWKAVYAGSQSGQEGVPMSVCCVYGCVCQRCTCSGMATRCGVMLWVLASMLTMFREAVEYGCLLQDAQAQM